MVGREIERPTGCRMDGTRGEPGRGHGPGCQGEAVVVSTSALQLLVARRILTPVVASGNRSVCRQPRRLRRTGSAWHFQEKAGFVVFRKHRQRLIPTREAHLLYAEIERSFISLREITKAAKDISDLRTGRVNIAALPRLGLDFLPNVLSEFSATHPSVAITLNVRDSETVIEWTGRRQVDFGFATTSAIDNPSVVRRAPVSAPRRPASAIDGALLPSRAISFETG